MIVTTTPSVEGKRIADYLGIVTGEAIIGANIIKDVFANVRDIVGGRRLSATPAGRRCTMAADAKERGADAVVGVDLDYEVLGKGNGMLMVSASGTAVRLD